MEITYAQIMSFEPCYDPLEIDMPEDYSASIPEFITEYRNKVKNKTDIFWVLCRNQFMSDKDLRLFAVWCARQVQHLMKDERSIDAVNIAEKYAYGEATEEELKVARDAAAHAAHAAADLTARVAAYVAWASAYDAAASNAVSAAYSAVSAVRASASASVSADRVTAYDAYVAWASAYDAADHAAAYNAVYAVRADAYYAAFNDACDAQINKLLAFFVAKENNQEFDWR